MCRGGEVGRWKWERYRAGDRGRQPQLPSYTTDYRLQHITQTKTRWTGKGRERGAGGAGEGREG